MGEPALAAIGVGSLLAGKYMLEKRLGAGGMGEVYQAQNVLIGRQVAIKVLKAEHAQNTEIVTRFMREAKAANLVRHPNVVDVLDVGQDENGTPFIVQELLEGEDLANRVTEVGGRVQLDVALRILLPVIDAVAFGHSKGVVHRDLKPENVFLAKIDGKVVPKLLDFGISQIKGSPGDKRMTATGIAMGTPVYMSPEQVQGHPIDARTDVWALGIIIHELLSGNLPFPADSQAGLFVQICTAPPVRIIEAAPHLPQELDTIVARCLKKPREERYNDAAELAVDLRKLWEALYAPPDGRPSGNHPPAKPARVDPEGAFGNTVRPAEVGVQISPPLSGNHAAGAKTDRSADTLAMPDLTSAPKAVPQPSHAVPDLAVPDLLVPMRVSATVKAAPAAAPVSVRAIPPPATAASQAIGSTIGGGFDDDDDAAAISGLKLDDLHRPPPSRAANHGAHARTGMRSLMPPAESLDMRSLLTALGLLVAVGLGMAGLRYLYEFLAVGPKVGAMLGDTKIDSGLQVTGGVIVAILGMVLVPKSYRSMREAPAAGIALSIVVALCFFLGFQLTVHAFD